MVKDKLNFNENTKIQEILDYPKFEEFSRYIFPLENRYRDSNTKISDIRYLLPYHTFINNDTTINVLKYMEKQVESKQKIFYHIYTKSEMDSDISKQNTGLFFFKGQADAPFAMICAGGGFSYVGSIHEAYPHAIELSQKGYNAFVLQYRLTPSEAEKDLARAISYVFHHSHYFKINTKGYSLWGSSAGARMVAYIGSYGVAYFGGENLPKPSTVIMAYTGHTDYSKSEVPTFAIVGEDDYIASPKIMKQRINNLKKLGIDAKIIVYPNLSHGFGLGIGTSAEGWINDAISFWKKHRN